VARRILSVSTGGLPRPNESPPFTRPRWLPLLHLGVFLFILKTNPIPPISLRCLRFRRGPETCSKSNELPVQVVEVPRITLSCSGSAIQLPSPLDAQLPPPSLVIAPVMGEGGSIEVEESAPCLERWSRKVGSSLGDLNENSSISFIMKYGGAGHHSLSHNNMLILQVNNKYVPDEQWFC